MNKIIILSLMIFVFSVFSVSAGSYNITNESIWHDVSVSAGVPDGRFGNIELLMVSSETGNQRSGYVMFDLTEIPTDELVTSAKLYGFITYSEVSGYLMGIYEVNTSVITTETWNEEEMTFNTQPCGNTAYSINESVCKFIHDVTTTGTGWYQYNISDVLNNAIARGQTNFTIMIRTNTIQGGEWGFASSEDTQVEHLKMYIEVETTPLPTTNYLYYNNGDIQGVNGVYTALANFTVVTSYDWTIWAGFGEWRFGTSDLSINDNTQIIKNLNEQEVGDEYTFDSEITNFTYTIWFYDFQSADNQVFYILDSTSNNKQIRLESGQSEYIIVNSSGNFNSGVTRTTAKHKLQFIFNDNQLSYYADDQLLAIDGINFTGIKKLRLYMSGGDAVIYNLSIEEIEPLEADIIAPFVSFVSPTPANQSVVNQISQVFNVSIVELNLDSIVFYWNGTAETDTFVNDFGNYWSLTKNVVSEDIYTYRIVVNDTSGNVFDSGTLSFTADNILPSITFSMPNVDNLSVTNGTHDKDFYDTNINIEGSNLHLIQGNLTVMKNGTLEVIYQNVTAIDTPIFTFTDTIAQIFSGQDNGWYIMRAEFLDEAGNTNYQEVLYLKDDVRPVVNSITCYIAGIGAIACNTTGLYGLKVYGLTMDCSSDYPVDTELYIKSPSDVITYSTELPFDLDTYVLLDDICEWEVYGNCDGGFYDGTPLSIKWDYDVNETCVVIPTPTPTSDLGIETTLTETGQGLGNFLDSITRPLMSILLNVALVVLVVGLLATVTVAFFKKFERK